MPRGLPLGQGQRLEQGWGIRNGRCQPEQRRARQLG